MFPGDRTGSKKLPLDYQGERTAKAMSEYVTSRIPSKYVHLVGSSAGKKAVSLEDFLKKEPTLKHVLLFTDKAKTSNTYKALALHFNGRLVLGEVRKQESDIIETFKVKSYPTLKVFAVSESGEVQEDSIVPFAGKMGAYSEIEDFLEEYALPLKKGKGSSASKDGKKPTTKPKAPFDPKIPEITTQEELEKHCLQLTEAFSNLCFLAFLPPLEKEYEESIRDRETFVKTLSSVKKAFHERKEDDGAPMPQFHFSFMDGTKKSSKAFINRFGVSSDLPSAMVVNPSKKAYRPFIGSFDEAGIKSFLEETGRGRGRVFQYEGDLTFGTAEKKHETKPVDESSCSADTDTTGADEGQCTSTPPSTGIPEKDEL